MHIKAQKYILKIVKKKWCDILTNKEDLKILEKERYLILSYMLIDYNTSKNIHYIEFINTCIKGHNFAKILTEKYIDTYLKNNQYLLPKKIIDSAKLYWKKYFLIKFDIKLKSDLINFEKKLI